MTDVKQLHPSAEDLARLLESDTSEAMRTRLLGHIAQCDECAEAVRVSVALESDAQAFADDLAKPESSESVPSKMAAPWVRQWAMAASLVMAVAAGFFVFQTSDPDPVVLRGATADVSPKPGTTISSMPAAFRWSNPTPGQFVLLDARARPLFEATAENGQIAVDGELAHVLSSGGQFLWRVDIDGRTLGPYPIEIKTEN